MCYVDLLYIFVKQRIKVCKIFFVLFRYKRMSIVQEM